MRKLLLIALLAILSVNISNAQRFTDELDRGIVAVNLGGQIFVSWRILPEEYYGTTYKLYKNGSLVADDIVASNWTGSGSASDQFTVAPVINGIEGEQSAVAKVWNKSGSSQAGYIDFDLQPVLDRNGNDVTHHYMPNDAIFADLDGDGQLDYIVKRVNRYDSEGYYTGTTETDGNGKVYEVWMQYPIENTTEFAIWDAYKLDWNTGTATRLWWIDCGPNMVSTNNTENNLLAYDWDMDGKAEVVMRGADNMYFHVANGAPVLIGTTANTRNDFDHHAGSYNNVWTKSGNEYLIYFNGETGKPYQVMDYPLKRYEPGENPNDIDAAWHGRGQYGHISSKYFFGAPYLDGHKPSIFLGRGIYTRHKMIAYDVNPQTHALTQRWEWHSTANGNTPGSYWYGNGYHNYVIADVDEDGRDEIIYGSMVIDDNGKGLNSTAFGHGDAMHVNDFDPYRKGLEIYTCIEDEPSWGMAYRSGLTGEVYKKFDATGDDGRALAGNFTNEIPGSVGKTAASQALALTSDKYVSQFNNIFTMTVNGSLASKINNRIYWDGDLQSEEFDGIGANDDPNGRGGAVFKWNPNASGTDRIFQPDGTTINGTKNNPSFQGDIIGDWREELVLRLSSGQTVTETHAWDVNTGKTFTYTLFNKIRVSTSAIPTSYPIYNLWGDHQYRQGMGTQMQTYNLPPNASFFLGEMEGITQAPPPLVNRGREEVRNGGKISTSLNGKHVMLAEVGNAQVNVENGASPKIFTDNAPWWVQGNNPSESQGLKDASTTVYTHTLTGAPFTGETMVVKQGGGTLILSGSEQSYTGDTKVWAGTLQFDGKMTNSSVWLNRFATLSSTGGEFKTVTAEYGSEIQPGGATANVAEVTVNNLSLGFGSRVVFDINGQNVGDNDQIHVADLTFETKTDAAWVDYGPENLKPVFQFNTTEVLPGGRYPIGTYTNSPQYALLSDIIIEGIDANRNPSILVDGGTIYLELNSMNPTSEPEISIIDMVQTDLTGLYPSSAANSYYMPKVGITVAEMNGVKPKLDGVFTDLYGNVTEINSQSAEEFYNVDYSNSGSAGDWEGQCTTSINTDQTHGNYLSISCSGTGSRYTKWDISNRPVTSDTYIVEFDAALGYSNSTNDNNNDNELILYGGIATAVSNNWIFSGTNYFFRISGGKKKGTTYTVTGDSKTITLANKAWAHYKITVDRTEKRVSYEITSGSSTIIGSYNLDDNVSTNMNGIFISLSRDSGGASIDNIVINSPETNFSEFTFKMPGTLRVKATGDASTASTLKTFTVDNPYVISYETLDYSTLAAENAATQLGWTNVQTDNTRWSNWFNNGGYTIVTNKSLKEGFIDKDNVVKITNGNNTLIGLVVGYGISHNYRDGTTFSADGLGNDKTIVYSKFYLPQGARNALTLEDNYQYANSDGSWSYAPNASNSPAIVKMATFIPVSVHDELLTNLPVAVTDGNAHLWRNGLNTTTTWASLVLPFDMTSQQVTEVFGENAQVANLVPNMGSDTKLYFETDTRTIHANKPVLIKGVSKAAPYLITGITSDPVAVPMVSNDYFQYIGNYDNKGSVPFYHFVDYFFSSNQLSTVKYDGVYMTLKGYRGYFHANDGAGASISVLFDDPSGVNDITTAAPKTFNVYSLSGQVIRSNTNSLEGLPHGIYIVNGKKYLVK